MTRVFISCASEEFRSLRGTLKLYLTRAGCHVEVQEDFRQTPEDTIEKLDGYIRTCAAVIHIIGNRAGSTANGNAVADFLAREPLFLQKDDVHHKKFADLRKNLGDLSDLTYTQWEAFIAMHHEVPLFVYQAQDSKPDASQERHIERLTLGRRYAQKFNTTEDLLGKLIGDLREIVSLGKIDREIASSRILRHAPEQLFGREKYLDALDEAWAAADHVNIYTLVAWGGVGKTSLVAHWVQQRMLDGWPEVERYFDWSFYSQGTGESRQTSSDLFISEALKFFGDSDPTTGSTWDRGQRLAGLIRQYRTLLVLDGIEPLQYPPTDKSGQAGSLKDQGLQSLLTGLASENPGLCIVTTRESVADLQSYRATSAPEEKVDKLLPEAAISLLRHLQVVGTDEELKAAWKDAGGHALTLQLLGRFIVDAFPDKDIRYRSEVKLEEADQERQGRSAFKVMAAYERWLQGAGEEQQRELAILRLTGLFDRPMDPGCLNALRAKPAIPNLTDSIAGLTDRQWNIAINRLQSIDLINHTTESPKSDASEIQTPPSACSLDAHPLIREYFAVQLRDLHPDAFRAGHSRLFDFLCQSSPYRPDTLEGLQPLYQAVVHGCLADRHEEARAEVYIDRILRERTAFSFRILGAAGADLSAISAFFVQPWTRLSQHLDEQQGAWLLNDVALRLRALGRMRDARQAMLVTLEFNANDKKWRNAAVVASNLGELELLLGDIHSAIKIASQGTEFADRSKQWDTQMMARVAVADATHQFGNTNQAHKLFAEAEQIQQEFHQYNQLYSTAGFRFCDLLLASAERAAFQRYLIFLSAGREDRSGSSIHTHAIGAICEAVQRRGNSMLVAENSNVALDVASCNLILARADLYMKMVLDSPESLQKSHLPKNIDKAISEFRLANTSHHLPKGLLTSAFGHQLVRDSRPAIRDLNEAIQIARRGPMPLYIADILLTRARLFGVCNVQQESQNPEYPWPDSSPTADLAEARRIIEKCHYHRRLPELEDAEMAINHPDDFPVYIAAIREQERKEYEQEQASLEQERRSRETARKQNEKKQADARKTKQKREKQKRKNARKSRKKDR